MRHMYTTIVHDVTFALQVLGWFVAVTAFVAGLIVIVDWLMGGKSK